MNARAQGFTMIELLIVTLLSAVVMGAVYQTLTVQLRSNRQVNAVVNTQQTIRTAVQILQAELREVGGRAGDVLAAGPDTLTVRSLRKVGFACDSASGSTIGTWTIGDAFANKDSLLVYTTRNPGMADDTLRIAYVNSDPSASACTGNPVPAGMPWDSLKVSRQTLSLNMGSGAITDISRGDPIRSFRHVTYGIFYRGDRYVLGRRVGSDSVVTLIGPLAPPDSGGMVMTYYDTRNQPLSSAQLAAQASRDSIARINIRVKGSTRGAPGSPGGVYRDSLVADLFLRGN